MRVVVIGAKGQVGSELVALLAPMEVTGIGHEEVAIENLDSVRKVLEPLRPDVIINCASYTNVEACEKNAEEAFRVNTLGAKNISTVSNSLGALVVYFSSDYVFGSDAARGTPYAEFDAIGPINVLGRSKVAGEQCVRELCPRHLIIRTSSVFGHQGSRAKGGNFVERILANAREKGHVQVVNDQVMSPSYARDLANRTVQLIQSGHLGTFHVTNAGACSWYDFTLEILRQAGVAARCEPVASEQMPTVAKRPGYSVLDHFHMGLVGMAEMPPWQEALREYLTGTR